MVGQEVTDFLEGIGVFERGFGKRIARVLDCGLESHGDLVAITILGTLGLSAMHIPNRLQNLHVYGSIYKPSWYQASSYGTVEEVEISS